MNTGDARSAGDAMNTGDAWNAGDAHVLGALAVAAGALKRDTSLATAIPSEPTARFE